MSSVSLTDRQQRERQYYDQYTQGRVVEKVDFEPIEGHEKRPWNSYWYVFQLASEAREQRPQRVLDFGCGQGERSLLLARLGYEVFGFDISQASVDSARKLAEAYHCDPMPQFSVQVAEHLDYPNEHFDLVVSVEHSASRGHTAGSSGVLQAPEAARKGHLPRAHRESDI